MLEWSKEQSCYYSWKHHFVAHLPARSVKTDNQCNNLLEEAAQPRRYVAPTRWLWQSCHMSLDEIGLWARIIFVEFKNVTKGTNTVLPQELSLAVKRCGIAITLESVAKTQENIIG